MNPGNYEELRELVVRAMGGQEAVERIAELPDVPKKMQPDPLRELARYILDRPESAEPGLREAEQPENEKERR